MRLRTACPYLLQIQLGISAEEDASGTPLRRKSELAVRGQLEGRGPAAAVICLDCESPTGGRGIRVVDNVDIPTIGGVVAAVKLDVAADLVEAAEDRDRRRRVAGHDCIDGQVLVYYE